MNAPRNRWLVLTWLIPVLLVALVAVVLGAQWLRTLPATQSFLTDFPGSSDLPPDAPVGFPAWLAWQHFLSSFFLLFIIRTGLQLRVKKRPAAFWTRTNTGVLATKGAPVRIGIPLWVHLSVDALWVVNGLVYVVLLFATGQWVRIVPLTWDIVPNAISAGLQYASLDWPIENSWVNYNALQVLSYFAIVFVASPLAILTGLRLAPGFAARLKPLDRVFSLGASRVIHSATQWFFLGFIVVHVSLVLATGALRNLNYMYAARDSGDWIGLGVFAASIIVMVVAWVAATPERYARVAEKSGTVRRMPQ